MVFQKQHSASFQRTLLENSRENFPPSQKTERLQIARHIVQVIVLVALNARAFGIHPTSVIVPYLHPTGAPYSVAHGVFDAIELSLSHAVFPLAALGAALLTGVALGKVLCGWACPFGLAQDLIAMVPLQRLVIPASTVGYLRDVKWGVVGLSVLCCTLAASRRIDLAAAAFAEGVVDPPETHPLGVLSDSPFSVFSPAATLFVYVPWMALWNPTVIVTAGAIGWIKIFLLLAAGISAALVPRFFCRYICPVSALLDPFARFKLLRIRRAPELGRDEYNKIMTAVCPTGVTATSSTALSDFVDHPACIHCGRCLTASPLLTQELSF